jgi:hypothetical protein
MTTKEKNKSFNITRKNDFLKGPTWLKCPHWLKGMVILTKGLKHERHELLLTKTFVWNDLFDHIIKRTKGLLRWPKLSQIIHIQWPLWLTINQIGHFDLTLDQINHINIDLIYLFIYL